jgi:hypothetical protein
MIAVEPKQPKDLGEQKESRIMDKSHIRKVSRPGDVVSVDQLESFIPGLIGQMTGKLIKQQIVGSNIYVDHSSDLSSIYHQTSMTSEVQSEAN